MSQPQLSPIEVHGALEDERVALANSLCKQPRVSLDVICYSGRSFQCIESAEQFAEEVPTRELGRPPANVATFGRVLIRIDSSPRPSLVKPGS